MSVYKKITLVGTSPQSVEDAIRAAVKRASSTIRNVSWFEVKEITGAIKGAEVTEFQVTLEIGFKVEEGDNV